MIYITGDVHNTIDVKKFNTKNFPEQKNMTREDLVFIAGDFGFPWFYDLVNKKESAEDKYWLDWFDKKKFTTVVIDGNHGATRC